MTQILTLLSVDYLDNNTYVALAHPFGFVSDVLAKHELRGFYCPPEFRNHPLIPGEVWGPAGFVYDFESVPEIIRSPLGINKRGGTAHDLVCRIDCVPGITKSIAADVYAEIMDYCDSIDDQRFLKNNNMFIPNALIRPYVLTRDWSRRWMKSTVVRIWPGDFFKKFNLAATAKEIYGMDGDPYVTIEKLETAITQNEQATDAIKAIPAQVEGKETLVKESVQVTDTLNKAKDGFSEDQKS